MNEPIISPWLIYLIDTLDGLVHVCFCMSIVAGGIAALYFLENTDDFVGRETREHYRKLMKKWFAASVVLALGVILLPSQETSYKMLAANCITPANIEKGTDAVKSSMNYLAETIIRIEKEGKK